MDQADRGSLSRRDSVKAGKLSLLVFRRQREANARQSDGEVRFTDPGIEQILLLHQHHERAQLLRTRLGQHLASVTSAHNHGPPDPVHLYDCTFIGAIWRLWEESRNYNSISQLEGFVKRASAELSSLGAVADETQKRSLEQAVESFKQLVEGLKGLSVALLGV